MGDHLSFFKRVVARRVRAVTVQIGDADSTSTGDFDLCIVRQ